MANENETKVEPKVDTEVAASQEPTQEAPVTPEAPKAPEAPATVYTNREGQLVPVDAYTVRPTEMISVHRLREDFEQRGEYLSLQGVMLHIIDKGIAATRHYWAASDTNKNRRDFAKQAIHLFDSNGNVRDPEALAKLAIEKGLVKGSKREV
jgi:hypothetical protein